MNVTPLTIARLALLLAGIVAFAYALNTGSRTMQYVAVGCVAAALLLRVIGRLTGRR
ncbi:MAG: hypothetical protein V4617_20350 [Gemmatimonadota bacterium]